MELTGKLIEKFQLQSGVSKTGNSWQKQEFIIETDGQYPKKIYTYLWGNNSDMLSSFNVGDMITISFDLESREYNNRWYTDVKTWRVAAANAGIQGAPGPHLQQPTATPIPTTPSPRTNSETSPSTPASDDFTAEDGGADDLPF